jgi:GTP cyclohydrolase I
MKKILDHYDVKRLARILEENVQEYTKRSLNDGMTYKVYPIPRGGVPVAYLALNSWNIEIVSCPQDADFFVDDIIDSGATLRKYCDEYPGKPFFALVNKEEDFPGQWVVFPWESSEQEHETVEHNVVRILQYVGEDPNREGLSETPKRVAKAWKHWCSGYEKKAADILKVFEDGAEKYDQMVIVKDIPIYSHCEHHLAAIIGTASIAYIPNGKIVGLSKLSRLADMFARRLQVQERLTDQIADALVENLQPLGVGVIIKARHLCMESRGVCQQGHHTITTALRGAIREEEQTRSEFLRLAGA